MSAGRGAAAEGPEVSGGGGNGLAVFAGSQDAAHDLETLSKHKVTGEGGAVLQLETPRWPPYSSLQQLLEQGEQSDSSKLVLKSGLFGVTG